MEDAEDIDTGTTFFESQEHYDDQHFMVELYRAIIHRHSVAGFDKDNRKRHKAATRRISYKASGEGGYIRIKEHGLVYMLHHAHHRVLPIYDEEQTHVIKQAAPNIYGQYVWTLKLSHLYAAVTGLNGRLTLSFVTFVREAIRSHGLDLQCLKTKHDGTVAVLVIRSKAHMPSLQQLCVPIVKKVYTPEELLPVLPEHFFGTLLKLEWAPN